MESLSNKGKRCFIYENNKFRSYRKDQQDNEYWRCTVNRCTARLKTLNVGEVVELISNHAHADTVKNEAVHILRTACKRKATDTACERPSKVIRTVLSEQAESDVSLYVGYITCELRCIEIDANTKVHYRAMLTRLSAR